MKEKCCPAACRGRGRLQGPFINTVRTPTSQALFGECLDLFLLAFLYIVCPLSPLDFLSRPGGMREALRIRRPPEFTKGDVACEIGDQCSKQIFEPPLPPPAPCIPPGRPNGCAILIFSGSKMHAQKRSANNSNKMLKYRLNGAK